MISKAVSDVGTKLSAEGAGYDPVAITISRVIEFKLVLVFDDRGRETTHVEGYGMGLDEHLVGLWS